MSDEILKILILSFGLLWTGCNNSTTGNDDLPTPEKPIDFDPIKETIPEGNQDPGFFLDDWQPKEITAPDFEEKAKPAGQPDVRIQVNPDNVITKVPPYVYGNNTNPYIGQMVTEPDLLSYLRDLNPGLIRFPGGNLSNLYFWDREPGDYPDDVPPPDVLLNADGTYRANESYWYGKNNQSWTLSLDNYYRMLEETGSKGVITVNYAYARYGTGTEPVAAAAGYAADWVRYDNGRTIYWEIGNENYGTWQAGYRIDTGNNRDGQPEFISGKLYGKHVRVFVDSMRAAAREIGADIKIGAQLIERKVTESWETDIVRNWNELYFSAAGNVADYYAVHNYYTPYQEDSSPGVILNSAHEVTRSMMQWMNETVQNNGMEPKPVALTEWNIFATGSQQMVSDISGMHASLVLGELIKYEYGMACRWDIANGWNAGNDHGMFNKGDAPGGVPKWNPRPDFYHMYYFQKYFGDRMVWSGTQGGEAVVSYASTFSSDHIGLVIANTGPSAQVIDVNIRNANSGDRYYWYTLTGGDGEGTYSRKVSVNGQGPDGVAGGPDNYKTIKAYSASTGGEEGIWFAGPPYSITYMLIEL